MTSVPATDADREAAKQFVHDYNVRDVFQSREGPIEDLADTIARARAEERERVLLVVQSALDTARGGQVVNPNAVTREIFGCLVAALEEIIAAIRARSEGGKA